MPRMTPLLPKFEDPVPPLLTPRTPDPMMLAGRLGISPALRAIPASTRPLASMRTLGYVPAVAPVGGRVGFGYVPVRSPPAAPVGAAPLTQARTPDPLVDNI